MFFIFSRFLVFALYFSEVSKVLQGLSSNLGLGFPRFYVVLPFFDFLRLSEVVQWVFLVNFPWFWLCLFGVYWVF